MFLSNSWDFKIVKNQWVRSHRKSKKDRIWGFSTVPAASWTFQKQRANLQNVMVMLFLGLSIRGWNMQQKKAGPSLALQEMNFAENHHPAWLGQFVQSRLFHFKILFRMTIIKIWKNWVFVIRRGQIKHLQVSGAPALGSQNLGHTFKIIDLFVTPYTNAMGSWKRIWK